MITRFCIDNGIMIAQAGLLSYRMGFKTLLSDSTCTQRSALYIKFFFLQLPTDYFQIPDGRGTRCVASLRRRVNTPPCIYFSRMICMNSQEKPASASQVVHVTWTRPSPSFGASNGSQPSTGAPSLLFSRSCRRFRCYALPIEPFITRTGDRQGWRHLAGPS